MIVLWMIQNAEPTQQPSCAFPRGSIACKIWNHTNMDCSVRALVCVPKLHHNASLKLLDLSYNKLSILLKDTFLGFDSLEALDISFSSISSLQKGVFMGLHNLLNLDLSNNIISFINDATFVGLSKLKHLDLSNINPHTNILISSPFQDLRLLQTLIIDAKNISSATFIGLDSLQKLEMRMAELFLHETFSQLSSLLYLSLDLETFNLTKELLNGLKKLEYLSITLHMECRYGSTNVDFSPLVSLQTLYVSNFYMLNSTINSLKTIPIKSLRLDTLKPNKQTIPFEILSHLTSLTWTTDTDSYKSMQALNLLDSPLQYLNFHQLEHLTLNSATFELCQEWSESLQDLEISVDNAIFIDGSPFQWFPKLLILKLGGQNPYRCIIQTLSNITFSSLSSLEELHLNFLHMDYLPSGTLDIFSQYNSLKVLDLSHNDMHDNNKLTHQICNTNISLVILDLSYNKLTFEHHYPCTLQNVKILHVGHQHQ